MKIFLTGGSGGIGREIIRQLASDGNEIYFTYFQNAAKARQLEEEFPQAKSFFLDGSRLETIESLKTQLQMIDFDCLINCAFPKITLEDLHKTSWDSIEQYILNAVRPAFLLTQAFSRSMKKRKSGQIVNILSSVVLEHAPAMMLPYVIAKYALLGLHRALAAELGKSGIRVHAVSPGMTRTDFLSLLPDHYVGLTEALSPEKRLLEPSEIAALVKKLILQGETFENGQNIPLVLGGKI